MGPLKNLAESGWQTLRKVTIEGKCLYPTLAGMAALVLANPAAAAPMAGGAPAPFDEATTRVTYFLIGNFTLGLISSVFYHGVGRSGEMIGYYTVPEELRQSGGLVVRILMAAAILSR